jgi:hypothetical protein
MKFGLPTFKPLSIVRGFIALGLISAIVYTATCAYSSKKQPLSAAPKADTIPYKPKINLDRFDDVFSLSIPLIISGDRMIRKDCKKVAIRIFVEKDSVAMLNAVSGEVILNGRVIKFAEHNTIIVCEATNLSSPVIFTLQKISPVDGGPSDQTILFHLGPSSEPFILLSKKYTCEELNKLLDQIN